jgi:hypothetical protein
LSEPKAAPNFDAGHMALIAKIGGHMKAATHDMTEFARSGQQGLMQKFYGETDASLPEDERWRRAEQLRRAHMSRITAKSRGARKKQQAAKAKAPKGAA